MTYKPYNSLDKYLKERFGGKLYKLALSCAETCPNRDGTVGMGGCIFCGEGGSGDFAQSPGMPVSVQIETAKALVAKKLKNNVNVRYIAYFQSFTSTYTPMSKMREAFWGAAENEEIAVVSVATRADCLPLETLSLLTEVNNIKPVWVELGLQTSNDKTAELINRCCPLSTFENSVKELKSRGLEVIVHIILGLPGETLYDMLSTIDYVNSLKVNGVKLQLLHVQKDTRLAKTGYTPMTLSEYTDALIACVERLSPDIVIHRLTGDGAKKNLISPAWSADKKKVLNTIHREMKVRGSFQGRTFVDFPKNDGETQDSFLR